MWRSYYSVSCVGLDMKKYEEFLALVKKKRSYIPAKPKNLTDGLEGIKALLVWEIGSFCDVWLDDISDPEFEGMHGEIAGVARKGDMFIVGGDSDGKPSKYDFVTTLENLQKIIRDWKAIKSDPRYNVIIMGRIGDQIIFEGRKEKHPYKKFLKQEPVTKL